MNIISFPGLGINDLEIKDSFSVFGWFDLRFYSTIIALGMVLAVLYAFWRFKENKLKLDTVLDYAVWLIPIGIVGARLYYVIFDMIEKASNGNYEYFDNVIYVSGDSGFLVGKTLDFFGGRIVAFLYDVVSVWNGGLAIYGGVIFGGFTIMIIALIKKTNPLKIIDIAVPSVMFAQAIGRWGNFFNVEAYGEVTDLPWRMVSDKIIRELVNHSDPNVRIDEATAELMRAGELGVHPTFLYESLWNLLGVIILITTLIITTKIIKVSEERRIEGFFFAFYMIWYGFARMFIETLRTDSLWLGPFRISVLVAIITFVIGILLMAFLVTRKVLQLKKNIDIWEMFKNKLKKKKEAEDGTNN